MRIGEFASVLSDGTPFIIESYIEPGNEEPRPVWLVFPSIPAPDGTEARVRIPREFPDGERIPHYTGGLISILAWGAKHRLETEHTAPRVGGAEYLRSLGQWEGAEPGIDSEGDMRVPRPFAEIVWKEGDPKGEDD